MQEVKIYKREGEISYYWLTCHQDTFSLGPRDISCELALRTQLTLCLFACLFLFSKI